MADSFADKINAVQISLDSLEDYLLDELKKIQAFLADNDAESAFNGVETLIEELESVSE